MAKRIPNPQSLVPWLLLLALWAGRARAHDTSSATIDQEVALSIREDALAVEYTVQLSRPAAFIEFLLIDTDGDGRLSPAEQARYFSALAESLRAGIELRINGQETPLRQVGEVELSMPFRKRYRFEAPQPAGWQHGATVEVHNDNYLDWNGAISISLDPGHAADIVAAALPAATNLVNGLPVPCQRDATFRYCRGTGQSCAAPASAAPEAGPEPAAESPIDGPIGRWQAWRRPARRAAWGLTLLAGGAATVLLLRRRWVLAVAALALAGGLALAATHLVWRLPVPNDLEAAQIFQELHRGIYRAFEARTEDEIYDTLSGSLCGGVLEDVYREVQEALLLRDRGTARFSVRRVKPLDSAILPADESDGPAFRVQYRWRVYGTVTHFGHTHARVNEYEAVYRVSRADQAWRISAVELRQQRRVVVGQWGAAS